MSSRRFLEIDLLRGIAICLMVVFHTAYDLATFYDYPYRLYDGYLYYIGRLSAILFIFLAGISATLSRSAIKHGLRLLGWALLISVLTYFLYPHTYIRFGILHLLATSLLSYPFLKTKRPGSLIIPAVIIWFIGNVFSDMTTSTALLLPLGLTTEDFRSLDYYPLAPWYAIFLFGVFVGQTVYKRKTALLSHSKLPDMLLMPGRNSLAIYLAHQPLILATLIFLQHIGLLVH